ncbi:MAG: hypothetical protein IJ242_11545 [Clostridia bacterium]|nr:hypothetical protein [Clostridia bacterium]
MMYNLMNSFSMNSMMAEDVNLPALRNPMNHLSTNRRRSRTGLRKWRLFAGRAAGELRE